MADAKRFSGKTVILSGAGSGIGRATATRFAAEGADVMLVGRRAAPLDETHAGISAVDGTAWAHSADVTDPAQVDELVAAAINRWGRIDILVNNAGVAEDYPFLDIPVASWDRVLSTNLKSVYLMSQRVAKEQVTAGSGGVHTHLASISAHLGEINFASYCAAKSGLLNLNRSIATELGRYGIRSNCVSPGFTETKMLVDNVPGPMMAYMRERFERVPIRKLQTVDEIAAAITFLSSDDASAISGTDLLVDGGVLANSYIVETFPSELDEPSVAG
jgi:NAD(P)-dependent dehydrogenase (short-subunit alcohol dehydrogenase family)